MAKHEYTRVKDKPDARDHHYNHKRLVNQPDIVDLSAKCSPVQNQDQLGACTGFSIVGALEYDENVQSETFVKLSEEFVYYNERDLEGTTKQDAGGEIRDGIKQIARYGAASEALWPYDESKFKKRPSTEAYEDGLKHKAISYASVEQSDEALQQALASGFPVVIGITVFASFEGDDVAQTGLVPMPDQTSEECLGGHAVLLVGYDRTKKLYKVRNSWGPDWGHQGYFFLPFAYLTDPSLAEDFWIVNRIA